MKKFWPILLILVVLYLVFGVVLPAGRMQREKEKASQKDLHTVARGDVDLRVIDTGTVDAVKSVEVRSRASGRLKRILVEEGDFVTRGQLIAVIDPQETQLQVDQTRAQLRGAQAGVSRAALEMSQRRVSSAAALRQAQLRLAQLESEMRVQPGLTDAAIRDAKAAYNSAVQEKTRMEKSIHATQKLAAESEVNSAEKTHRNADIEYRRQQDLENQGFVARRVVEDARLALELAQIRLEKSHKDLATLLSQQRVELQQSDQQIARAKADLDRVLANRIQDANKRRDYQQAVLEVQKARSALSDVQILAQARNQSQASVSQINSSLKDSLRQLGETQIRAPMDGIVAAKLLEVGDLVTGLSGFSQGTSIFRIENRGSMRVKLAINEIDVARVTQDMAAKVTVDAIPNKVLTGRVRKIAPTSSALSTAGASQQGASESVVKYAVEIWLDETYPELRSGMSARCTLDVANRKNVVRIPVEFVGKDNDGSFVMVAQKDGRATKQRVTIGLKTGSFAEVLSGLAEGTKIRRPDYTGPKREGFMSADNE